MGCLECMHYNQASDGENGQYQWHECALKPAMANLRSFPFKKKMPCFTLNFWHSEFAAMQDGTDEADQKATALWRAKYLDKASCPLPGCDADVTGEGCNGCPDYE